MNATLTQGQSFGFSTKIPEKVYFFKEIRVRLFHIDEFAIQLHTLFALDLSV